MYQRLLIATDGSELSDRAVRHGARLAASVGAEVVLAHIKLPYQPLVIPTYPFPVVADGDLERHRQRVDEAAAALLEAATGAARQEGAVRVRSVSPEHEEPWEGLIACARNEVCDLIVMASHGRNALNALLLGSETQKVLANTTIPVLVVR